MDNNQAVKSSSGREFATFPAAVLAIIVNEHEEFLLIKRPDESRWEVPGGALESGESPILTSSIQNRVLASSAALNFSDSNNVNFPNVDLELALKADCFPFAMKVLKENNNLILRPTID
ncbi:MAG: 8-oxo-dGTP pyrophosphatase MutT (NUDIX family) [Gammaproteobacteria bacterium]|jgi:8-oxo-dGTP pyrophosphatase MutT (NUDIX family)